MKKTRLSFWISTAMLFVAGLSACGRQDSVFSGAGPTKPPTSVKLEAQQKFLAAEVGDTTSSTLTLSVRGGHLPKVLLAEVDPPFRWAGGGAFPGQGGTCDPLGLSDRCRVEVEYVPGTLGTHTSQLRLSYEPLPGGTSTWSSALSASTPAVIQWEGSTQVNFGTSYVGQATEVRSMTLRHVSGGKATDFALSTGPEKIIFEGKDLYPGNTGTCASEVGEGTCTIALAVKAERTGQISQPVVLSYHDGKQRRELTLQATGSVRYPPKLLLLPLNQNLGQVYVGGTATIPLTVQYTEGDQPATGLAFLGIAGEMSFPGGSYPGTGGTCGTQISTGTCTLNLAVSPSTAGAQSRTLTLMYRSGSEWHSATAQFSFTAVPPARLVASPASISFPTTAVGQWSRQTVTLTHAEGIPSATAISTTLPSGFRFAGGSFPGTGGTCTTRLDPAQSCTLVVEFAPTTRGSPSGDLQVSYEGGVGGSGLTVPLQATTEAELQLTVGAASPAGTVLVGATSTRTITVTHRGGTTATQLSPSLSSGEGFSITNSTCGASLAAGSCDYTVRFAPSASGNFSSSFSLQFSNGVSQETQSASLTATAAATATLVSLPTSIQFGNMITTGSSTQSIQLSVPASAGAAATSVQLATLSLPFSVTSNGCGTTINPGQSCTVSIRAQPNLSGLTQRNLTVSFNDGVSARTLTVPLEVTGQLAAILQHSPSTTLSFGTVAQGESSSVQTWEIRHTSGDVSASNLTGSLSSGFQFAGGSFPGTGGTCSSTLAVGASCTIAVVFSPTTSGGTFSGSATIAYNNGATNTSAARSISGSSNARLVLPTSQSFGTKAVGSTSSLSVTVTQQGYNAATSMSGTVTGASGAFQFLGGSYPGTGGTCGTSLSSGASCTVFVAFAPSSSASHSGTLTMQYSNGSAMVTATTSLSGTGSSPAVLQISGGTSVSPMKLVGSSSDLSLTLSHVSGAAATSITAGALTLPFRYKGGTYPGTGGNCGASLLSGQSCTLVVSFAPTNAGSFTSSLNINYNDGLASAQASAGLSGSAGAVASLTSSASAIAFGQVTVGQVTSRELTLQNSTGSVPATNFRVSGLSSPFSVTTDACSSLASGLSAAASCSFSIRFTASQNGRHSQSFQVIYWNGSADVTLTIPVTGQTPASFSVSPATAYAVGQKAAGGSHSFTYTVTRSGGPTSTALSAEVVESTGVGTLSFAGGSFPGTGGTCTHPQTADSCTIVMSMALANVGNFSGTWKLVAETGAGPVEITRSLSGEAKTRAYLELSDATLTFPMTSAGQTSQRALVVSNVGSLPLQNLSGTVASSVSSVYRFAGGSFPGLGGSCSSSLAAADSCTVVLEFRPSGSSVYTGTVTINAFDGLSNVSQNVTLGHQVATGASKLSVTDLGAKGQRRWAIPDVDGDGLWDQLWLPSSDAESLLVLGSTTGAELGRVSRSEAIEWLSHDSRP